MKNNKIAFYLLLLLTAGSFGCKKDSPFIHRHLPETTINGNDPRLSSDNIHLSKDTVYILAAYLGRDSGQTLSIEAGTLIKVKDRLAIIINPGATIEAKGTASDPIVFTSFAYEGSPGAITSDGSYSDHYWSGIRIYGNSAGASPAGSGTMSYVRIEFAGGDASAIAWPGLLLQNVTHETTLENIQVSYSYANPSFEFSGGDCNARNLVSYGSGNSDFYLHQGYKGMLQDLLAYRLPYFPLYYNPFNFAGMLISEAATEPLISNLSVIGPDQQNGTTLTYTQSFIKDGIIASLITTGGCKFHIRNSAMSGFPRQGWALDNNATATSLVNGTSDLTYSILHCDDSSKTFYLKPGTYGGNTSADFKNFMLQSQFSNQQFLTTNEFALTDPYNYNKYPNPLPKTGSPLLNGANFDSPFSDAFFQKVNYLGAIGTDNWLKGWTNFLPLQTNYNN
jgi:hypothetical protein